MESWEKMILGHLKKRLQWINERLEQNGDLPVFEKRIQALRLKTGEIIDQMREIEHKHSCQENRSSALSDLYISLEKQHLDKQIAIQQELNPTTFIQGGSMGLNIISIQ